jgi:hypothetical protein
MRLFLGLAVAAACISTPAVAAADADTAPGKGDKVVCKREQAHELGSHMRAPKVCMKKSEWDEIADRTARDLRRLNQRGIDPAKIKGGR